jgi:ABC-type transport system involved in multi-copper enzyme maturation permease subunit
MTIHDQNYARYEGTLREDGHTWVIAWTTLRVMLGFMRSKLVLLFLWAPVLVTMVLIFIEYGVRNSQLGQLGGGAGEAPGPGGMIYYLQLQVFSLALLFAASGCGVIADDLRYRAVQLYFSKPITRMQYGAGKLLGLFLFGSLVTILPALLLAGMRLALIARGELIAPMVQQAALGVGISALITVTLTAIVTGLSSLTSRSGYVVLAWIGVLMVPTLMMFIIMLISEGHKAARLASLPGLTLLASEALLAADGIAPVPAFVPFLLLAALAGAGLWALTWRISKLEGIA